MRWLWIDNFVEFRRRKSARAVKNLSLAEDHFADHFPGCPIMPAALMLEGLAQTGGILVGEANDFKEKVVLAKIVWAKFHREAFAGEQLIYDVEVLHLRDEGASIQGKIFAVQPGRPISPKSASNTTDLGDIGLHDLVGEAEIFFAHLDQARSQQIFGDHNFVFSGELGHMLKVIKKLADQGEQASHPSSRG